MSKLENMISPQVRLSFFRLFLRSLPFVPAPELADLLKALKSSRNDLDKQVTDAIESLKRSSELVSQLEQGLKERSSRLDELRKDYERYSQLADIEEKKVEALLAQLQITLGKGRGKERWIAVGLNFLVGLIFFVAGILLSSPLQAWAKALLGMKP